MPCAIFHGSPIYTGAVFSSRDHRGTREQFRECDEPIGQTGRPFVGVRARGGGRRVSDRKLR